MQLFSKHFSSKIPHSDYISHATLMMWIKTDYGHNSDTSEQHCLRARAAKCENPGVQWDLNIMTIMEFHFFYAVSEK